MNEMRKLMESIDQIEEGHFSELDIEHQEEAMQWLKRNRNGELTLDEITRIGRESFQAGKAGEISREAAEHVYKIIRKEYESIAPAFPKEFGTQGRWAMDYAKKHGKIAAYRGPGQYYVGDQDMPTLDEDDTKGVNDKYDDETLNCKHCGDYYCTSKFGGECPKIQKDLFDDDNSDLEGGSGDDLFVNDEQHAQITAALRKRDPALTINGYGPGKDGTINVMASTDVFRGDDDMGDRHLVFDPAYGDFIDDDGFNDWIADNPFESVEGIAEVFEAEDPEIKYLQYPEGYEPPKMPERHVLDGIDWMYVPDNVVQMMKSLEHKMVSQKVWNKGVELAGGEDKLWKVIQWRAEEIEDRYHGSGDGIGSSDMNHFVRGVFSDIGEDDIWGWDKPKEVEEDTTYRGPQDPHGFGNFGWSEQARYTDVDEWQGKVVKIIDGEHAGEDGTVVKADWIHSEEGVKMAEFEIKLHNGPVIQYYPSEYGDSLRLTHDPRIRPDGKYDPALEESEIDEDVKAWMDRFDKL